MYLLSGGETGLSGNLVHLARAPLSMSDKSPDEIAVAANFLLGPDAGFVTGSDLLIDGGVISAMLANLLPTP